MRLVQLAQLALVYDTTCTTRPSRDDDSHSNDTTTIIIYSVWPFHLSFVRAARETDKHRRAAAAAAAADGRLNGRARGVQRAAPEVDPKSARARPANCAASDRKSLGDSARGEAHKSGRRRRLDDEAESSRVEPSRV